MMPLAAMLLFAAAAAPDTLAAIRLLPLIAFTMPADIFRHAALLIIPMPLFFFFIR